MGKHITEDHDIHEMSAHAIQTVTWVGAQNIDLYDSTSYSGASVIMQINDGTNYERIIFEVGHNSTSTGYDDTRILLNGAYIDLTFSTSIVSDNFRITITNGTGATNVAKYYVIPSDL